MLRPTTSKTSAVVYSDILTGFTPNPVTGNLNRVTGEQSIKQSIRNLVLTNQGERVYNNSIGGSVRDLLFELLTSTSIEITKTQLRNTIQRYETRVEVLQIEIANQITDAQDATFNASSNYNLSSTGVVDENSIVVNIVYRIINIDTTQSLSITVERTR